MIEATHLAQSYVISQLWECLQLSSGQQRPRLSFWWLRRS
jgi:hypothetical protein